MKASNAHEGKETHILTGTTQGSHGTKKSRVRACKMAQQVRVHTIRPGQPKFYPWSPHGRRIEQVPASCPLVVTCVLRHVGGPQKKKNEKNLNE